MARSDPLTIVYTFPFLIQSHKIWNEPKYHSANRVAILIAKCLLAFSNGRYQIVPTGNHYLELIYLKRPIQI